MKAITLNTSGFVENLDRATQDHDGTRWSDLDPFTQGYVEALFTSDILMLDGAKLFPISRFFSFSDLAPETLAAILKDCECGTSLFAGPVGPEQGAEFWMRRQRGDFLQFPMVAHLCSITVYLGGDGKVYLRGGKTP